MKIAACIAVGLAALIVARRGGGAQETLDRVRIEVHADQADGSLPPIWNFFGYDEPNYTYAQNGKKLLSELAALSRVPVYVRTHNLLTTGDGSASLKWGSTNAYTEDAAGRPVYSWTIVDRIFDAFRDARVKPLVEIGFMPEALSTRPQPYRHSFPQGSIYTGWAYPPKDYHKWSELVFQLVRHLRERYGEAEAKTWWWEVWNEPDIEYWKGTPEEFFKLYDYSADAVQRALPGARIGGPDSTGPAYPKAAQFLRAFLEHCAREKNFASGKTGSQLDFISFHPKGAPKWEKDHVVMGIARQLASVQEGLRIVKSFPEWQDTPVILGESDPEGCAACSARNFPQNGYRNGPLYAVSVAEALNATYKLAEREQVRVIGAVTWAFEFEDQPYFEGFRELATNGVDKPVLNAFRMFGLLGSDRVKVSSSAALPIEEFASSGVRQRADIRAIATRKDRAVQILAWNYHDEDIEVPAALIDLLVTGLPESAKLALVEHFRVDRDHSNAYTAWKEMGSPRSPSAKQYELLEQAGQLQVLTSPTWKAIEGGELRLPFALPRQGLSLVRVTW
jgi:xylan 1,4-beta-xylosidase